MPLLARDDHNAFSLYRSAYADQKTSKTAWATGLAGTMAFNEPTAEQAFVGPLLELGTSVKDAQLAVKR